MMKEPNRGFLRELGCVTELRSTTAITLEGLRAAHMPELELRWFAREQAICAADPAVYVFHKHLIDRLARLARRHQNMTVGLTTALWLTDVLPQRPAIDHWVIPHAKLRPVWLPAHAQVHLSRHAGEDCWLQTLDRIEVRVSPPLRATLDCIRFRDRLGRAEVVTALRAALHHRQVGLDLLRGHARFERLEKPLLGLLDDVTTGRPCPPESPSSAPPAPPSPAP